MKIIVLLLLALFVMPSVAPAAGQDEPTIYVIKQGDTLWGLSERFIKDPEYWPNMWSKNGQITNPHFIYPGEKVRVFPDRLEFIPAGAAGAPAQKRASAAVAPSAASAAVADALHDVVAEKTYTLYGSEGFLVEKDFKPFGLVVGAQHDRLVNGVDDIVYTDIGAELNVKGGDKFSLFRKDSAIKHPVNNEEMGFKLIPLGALQLTDVEKKASRAIITESFKEISPGAYLLPYKESRRREISLKNTNTDLKGYIIESLSGISAIATGDIVYIDLGSSQGAAVGNLLYVVREMVIDQRYVEGRIDALPQEVLGALVILNAGKRTSTALVVKNIDTIYKGDRIVSQTK
jgi:hypothetical protein